VSLDGGDQRVATLALSGPDSGSNDQLAQPSATGVGDVNGDGNDDVAVGSPRQDDTAVWVVTNLAPGSSVSLDALGGDGFRVDGAPRNSSFGGAVSRAGDVNGDGVDDMVIGAPDQRGGAGAAYVVFGSRAPSDVDVSALSDRGFILRGASGTSAGGTLAGLGDVNGDGRGDFAVGAPFASPEGRTRAGVAYVVFGRHETSPVDLTALGAGGYRIDGQAAAQYEQSGAIYGSATTLAAAGDVDGDGRPDLALNAARTGPNDTVLAYVVYGKATTTRVDLAHPGGQALALEGDPSASIRLGDGVDFDGDKVFELPFSLGGEGIAASDGYLLKVKR
jgi:hypothetical protein